MSDTFEQEIRFTADPAAAARLSREIGQAIRNGFEQAFRGIESDLNRIFTDVARGAGPRNLADGFDLSVNSARRLGAEVDELENDLADLARRGIAFRDSLEARGLNTSLAAVYDAELAKALRIQRDFQEQSAEIARDPALLKAFQERFREIGQVLRTETSNMNRVFEGQQSAHTAAMQQETTLQNAIIRTRAQREIQQAQSASRARIEIARFTFRQIAFLEQQIARLFRGAAGAVGTGLRGITAAASRIGQALSRTNRDMNDGLNAALRARESSIDRSFARQTNEVRSAIAQQTTIIQRFEQRSARGLAGIVSGRSTAGSLLGGGLAVGGGFALFSQLRQGFTEVVALNEGINAATQVFKESTDAVLEWSKTSVESLFLTRSEAVRAATDFGIFANAAKLTDDNMVEFSTTLTELATDLASFKNTDVQTAVTALASAMRGEAEPIRQFGVLLNEQVLQNRALALGLIDTRRQLQPSERILAAYAEILQQTSFAQGDAARTADDFANSARRARAAMVTTFAALLTNLVPVAEVITNAAFPAFEALTDFINGDVNPTLQTLRVALIGAGAAMGALLAAKAAAEALGFLATAMRAVLTPMGLFITSVALLGAGIAVFMDRSPAFAEMIRGLVDALGGIVGRGLEVAIAGFNRLTELLVSRAIPALLDFAQLAAGPVISALEIGLGVITTVIAPAFAALAGIIVDEMVPAFLSFGRFLSDQVIPALARFGSIAGNVLGEVVRFLDPAIDGFSKLGAAIVGAFTAGDVAGLLSGLQAAVSGVGRVFANLGILLFESLRPQVERAVAFIVDAFQGLDLGAIAAAILNVVRIVGFVLGAIVSDPRFIQALEAIALAAVAIGGSFVQGFIQGVSRNLPELISMLGDQLLLAFRLGVREALQNPEFVAIAIVGLFAASQVRNAWLAVGSKGAGHFLSGFGRGLRSAPGQATQLLDGLFGGQVGINTAIRNFGLRTTQRLRTEFSRITRDLQRLGQSPGTIGGLNLDFKPTENQIRILQRRFQELEGQIGSTRVNARLFSQRVVEGLRGIGTAARETGRIFTGSFDSNRMRAGFNQTFTAISDGFARLRANGQTAGTLLGNAFMFGFAAALSGAQGGTIGLAGVVASAIGAGLQTGSAAIGAAVGVIGILSFALKGNRDAAEEAAAKIRDYADAIREAQGAAADLTAVASRVEGALQAQGNDVLQLLADSGFNVREFSQDALAGLTTIDNITASLATGLGATQTDAAAAGEEIKRLGLNADETADLFRLLDNADDTTRESLRTIRPEVVALADVLKDRGVDLSDFGDALAALGTEEGAVQTGLIQARLLEALNPPGIEAAGEKAARQFQNIGASGSDAAKEIAVSFADIPDSISGGVSGLLEGIDFERFDLSPLRSQLDSFVTRLRAFKNEGQGSADSLDRAFEDIRQSAEEAIDPLNLFDDILGDMESTTDEAAAGITLVSEAIQHLNRQRTEAINLRIQFLRDQLEGAEEAANTAREALTAFLTGNFTNSAQDQVDELISNIGNIGSEIEDALSQGGIRGDAAARVALGGFENQIAQIIQAGFEQGLTSQAEFEALLSPLFGALDEEINDSASRILSDTDFDFGISAGSATGMRDAITRALEGNQIEAGVSAIFNADAEVQRIQDQLDFEQAQLDVNVKFDSNQISQALQEAGLGVDLVTSLDLTDLDARQAQGLVAAVNAFIASTQPGAEEGGGTADPNQVFLDVQVSGVVPTPDAAVTVTDRQNAAIAGRPVAINQFGRVVAL